MARIMRLRVFPDREDLDDGELPRFYRELLDCFFNFREQHAPDQVYEVGTTELLDAATMLRRQGLGDQASIAGERARVKGALSLMAKHGQDADRLSRFLDTWQPVG